MEATQLKQGDLVKWYEYYADGDIIRDGGVGIILEGPSGPLKPHWRFKVFCTKKHAAQWFNVTELELIKKGTYVPTQQHQKKEK